MTPIKFAAVDFAELASGLDTSMEFNADAASRPGATIPAARRIVRKPSARRYLDLGRPIGGGRPGGESTPPVNRAGSGQRIGQDLSRKDFVGRKSFRLSERKSV